MMEAPAWLLDEAKKHWQSIAPMLEGMGLSSPVYSPALAMLVNSIARYIEFEEKVNAEGAVSMTDKGNQIVNPMWAARNKAWDQVMKALREFGMTPAALASVAGARLNKDDDGADDGSAQSAFMRLVS